MITADDELIAISQINQLLKLTHRLVSGDALKGVRLLLLTAACKCRDRAVFTELAGEAFDAAETTRNHNLQESNR